MSLRWRHRSSRWFPGTMWFAARLSARGSNLERSTRFAAWRSRRGPQPTGFVAPGTPALAGAATTRATNTMANGPIQRWLGRCNRARPRECLAGRRSEPPPDSPTGPREREVRDLGEPELVLAEAEQQ